MSDSNMQKAYQSFKYGDDINTDYIISGKYKFKSADMEAMAVHAMEELDPNYFEKVKPKGGYLVAGTNFGCGSSREQAPLVLIHSNTQAVLAKSFARIFYRNAINTGLPVVVCDTDQIDEGDEIIVDLENGVVNNITQGTEITFAPLPPVMAQLLADGGLVAHFEKHGGFNLGKEHA
jgi:3-isopropylmalate/(R)-2-methylmalate dehydratase small subunit